ncbi:MAG: DUF3073 domain-containing protein [Rhodoglobus sp.]|jgi:hypothetical protein|nr:DUF3073 domain-containing protein [Rhodoglobus sp.]
MGRGRQKAKHTKVARDLKYFSPDTNYGALERELAGSGHERSAEDLEKWPEYVDSYSDPYEDDLEDSDEESKTA